MLQNNQNPQYNNLNNYQNYNYPTNTSNKKKKIVLIVFCVVALFVVVFVLNKKMPINQTNKAKEAARKEIPNAEVKQVVVADGFAIAIVYSPKDTGQLGSGNTIVFKVNKDSSMTYLANASDFDTIDLLNLGIPLTTQAKLKKTDLNTVKKNLENSCNYTGDFMPGFSGFDGSFDPDGWQIDSTTLNNIQQALVSVVKSNDAYKNSSDKIVCINALTKDSNIDTNQTTFESVFLIKLQFITGEGKITDHSFSFTDGPINSRVYSLDNQKIESY